MGPPLSSKPTPPTMPPETLPPTSPTTPLETPPPTSLTTPPLLSFKPMSPTTPPETSPTTPLTTPPLTSPPTSPETPPPTPPPLSLRSQMVRTSSTSSTSTTPRCSIRVTGLLTRRPDHTTTTAPLPSPTTGRVLNNALSPGNAEAPECAREADGAPASTDARDPHSQLKLQVFPPPTERHQKANHLNPNI